VDSATPVRAVPRARSWGDWSTPRRLDALRAVQLALERRGRAPGGGVATADRVTPFNPGRRRYLFVPDRPEDRLVRMTLGASFDTTLAEADQLTAAPQALDGEGCRGPYAAQASLSGDKVYLACRDSNQVLVWSANENRGAAFGGANRVVSPAIALKRGGTSYSLPNFSSIQMGLSADGQILAVPLAGRRIAFIDTRSDRIAEVRRFASTVNVGEVRAVAFDSRDTLLAVTSEAPQPGRPARGQLVRRPRHATQPRWSIDTSRGLTVRRLYVSGSADLDEPRGLAIDRRDDGDHVYVFYGGSLTDTAATSHRTTTLAPASATAPRIRENVSGRRGPEFSAGGFVSSRVADSVLETATSLASGMAIDSLGRRAFVAFRGTGNLGYLPAGTGPFDSLFAATRILGNFPEPRVEQRTALVTIQVDPSGNASTTEVVATPDFRDGRLYEQTQFPLSLALDPGGELLAAHLTGRPSALRFWSARKIEDAFVAMTDAGDPFGSTTLDTRAVDPWVADFPIPVLAAPSLTFNPTLVIAAPGPGISRGALGVHVVTRDERIDRIDCAVLNPSTRAVVRTDSGLTIDPSQTRLGVPRRTGGGSLGSLTPVCRFPNVPAGRWLLRVHAETSTGGELVTETPFVQERW
jgi:hypothetical protein